MSRLWLILFWVSLAWLIYVYFGYAVCLWALGFFRGFRDDARPDYAPRVSVLISARNEEKDIEWKVRETLDWNYPPSHLELLIASDASEDRTDEILQGVRDPRLKYTRMTTRVGKNEALNRLAQVATGEILLFTDANSHVGPDCLRSMVAHFADARVGCVTGTEHTLNDSEEMAVSYGTRAYLDYEFLVGRLESRLGSVVVCDGSIFCVRRSLFGALQPDLANDLELPLRIGGQGYAILCEPGAWSTEKAMRSPEEEYNRKRRICGQGVLGLWRLRRCLHGFRAWQFFSRKVLRWLALVPLAFILAASISLRMQVFFAVLLGLQAAFYAMALLGWYLAAHKRKTLALLSLPFYFLLVNIAAVIGVLQGCSGKRFAVWEVSVLSRGQENA